MSIHSLFCPLFVAVQQLRVEDPSPAEHKPHQDKRKPMDKPEETQNRVIIWALVVIAVGLPVILYFNWEQVVKFIQW